MKRRKSLNKSSTIFPARKSMRNSNTQEINIDTYNFNEDCKEMEKTFKKIIDGTRPSNLSYPQIAINCSIEPYGTRIAPHNAEIIQG